MSHAEAAWPGGKRVAVAVSVLFETWADGKWPSYSVQTTALKPGAVDHAAVSWASYGGREGVWRILRTLDRHGVPATFFANARCVEVYPQAARAIASAGHDFAGHGITQDALLAYMDVAQQRQAITTSLEVLRGVSTRPVIGWLSPVLAYTPETVDLLAEAGLKWHSDVNYSDRPHVVQTKHGALAAIPNSEFTDNRVLRASPRDYVDVYKHTFDYLRTNEPGSLLVVALHCQFGGRPMIIAALDEIFTHIAASGDAWFARHDEIADWAFQAEATRDPV
jgi:allantoinase